jgi:gluconokinase
MLRVVVMGVAGSGKSTVATALAGRLGLTALDADDFHPAENVAKMSAGVALTDDDRRPWLERLRDELAARDRVVLACSALKQAHRDLLRQAGNVRFVYLDVGPDVATGRIESRAGHFMGAGMVTSQFDALEPPRPDEADVVHVDATRPVPDVVDSASSGLGLGPADPAGRTH